MRRGRTLDVLITYVRIGRIIGFGKTWRDSGDIPHTSGKVSWGGYPCIQVRMGKNTTSRYCQKTGERREQNDNRQLWKRIRCLVAEHCNPQGGQNLNYRRSRKVKEKA